MARSARVNYHVAHPPRQRFVFDADGVIGQLDAPELAQTAIAVADQRRGEATVDFGVDRIAFEHAPTCIGVFTDDGAWRAAYDHEIATLLTRVVGAREVVVFDHTIRVDDPTAVRRPARNVHTDYSPTGARARLIDLLGAERAAAWAEDHYAFINVWRPLDAPVNSAPLGFVRPHSVRPDDWILLDLIYPDRVGQILGLVARDGHEWLYRSAMSPDEVVIFTVHDSLGAAPIAHSALDLVEDPAVTRPRRSVESRALVRFSRPSEPVRC